MLKPLIRWTLVSSTLTALVMILAGDWTDPWLWAYAVAWWATSGYALLSIDDELARERFNPPAAGADRWALLAIQLVALAHLLVGALDNRWQLTPVVSPSARVLGLAGMTLGFLLFFRAMRENRFFSTVVRIQSERHHRVVSTGPYSFVRHPGYAGMIVAVPLSGMALGSWMAAGVGVIYSVLILRRVAFEDGFLHRSLGGYTDYARQVPYRLVPRIW
jgi:protein-S-isoprenylcysteine O-methyltransferase Ste14